MKKSIQFGLAITAVVFSLNSCKAQKSEAAIKIVLKNTSDIALPQKAVEIKRSALRTYGNAFVTTRQARA